MRRSSSSSSSPERSKPSRTERKEGKKKRKFKNSVGMICPIPGGPPPPEIDEDEDSGIPVIEWESLYDKNEPAYTARYSHESVIEKMDYIKRRHRPKLTLEAWRRYDYFESFPKVRAQMIMEVTETEKVSHKKWLLNPDCPSKKHGERPLSIGVQREHVSKLTVHRFQQQYERNNLPVMLQGAADKWAAARNWSYTAVSNSEMRNARFKSGEDDNGRSLRVRIKYYLQYMRFQKDDSPLYLFEDSFDTDHLGKVLLREYDIPKYFRDDLFKLVGEKRRPPYRWWLIGPERSGTTIHIDPLATSAWNTLIRGHKYWVIFPPHVKRRDAKGLGLRKAGEDGEGITWFYNVLPRMKKQDAERKARGEPTLGMVEFIQRPGETIFIPGGWWHAVLNLDDTLAVTQNFCSRINFDAVWRKTRSGRKRMALRWIAALKEEYPWLAQRALELNKIDGWEFPILKRRPKKPKKHSDSSSDSSTSDSSSDTSSSDSSEESSSSSEDEDEDEDEKPASKVKVQSTARSN